MSLDYLKGSVVVFNRGRGGYEVKKLGEKILFPDRNSTVEADMLYVVTKVVEMSTYAFISVEQFDSESGLNEDQMLELYGDNEVKSLSHLCTPGRNSIAVNTFDGGMYLIQKGSYKLFPLWNVPIHSFFQNPDKVGRLISKYCLYSEVEKVDLLNFCNIPEDWKDELSSTGDFYMKSGRYNPRSMNDDDIRDVMLQVRLENISRVEKMKKTLRSFAKVIRPRDVIRLGEIAKVIKSLEESLNTCIDELEDVVNG